MLTNYLLVAIRNLFRQKGYSFINIFGLALGISAAMFIFIWVSDEVSMNRFHKNIEQIYMVEQDQDYNGDIFHVTVTAYPAGEGWKKEIPEIETAVRVAQTGALLAKYGDKAFYENGIACVDSTFLNVFTFPLEKGDPNTVLQDPGLLKKLPINNSLSFDFLIPFDFTRITGAYINHW